MGVFDRFRRYLPRRPDPDAEQDVSSPVARPDQPRAGTGLPSRALPRMIGVVAVAAALYVAFRGGPKQAPPPRPQPAAQAAQAQATPNSPAFETILNHIRKDASAVHGNGSNAHSAEPTGGGLSLHAPTPESLQRNHANHGNIAASAIIALQGAAAPATGTAASSAPAVAVPAAETRIPQGHILEPVTHVTMPPGFGGAKPVRPRPEDFLKATAKATGHGYGPRASVLPPLAGAVLYPGAVLPATTVTAVNTQLPGTVVAQVTRDVYGRNGRVAVPGGARLVGRYDSDMTNGQTRVLVAFQRVIFPDGRELVLGDAGSAGPHGTAGTKADVDNHFFKMLGASLLVALLDNGVAAAGPQQSVVAPSGAEFSGTTQAGAQAFSQAAQSILQPYTDLQPIGIIPSGTAINVLVNKTVVIPGSGGASQ